MLLKIKNEKKKKNKNKYVFDSAGKNHLKRRLSYTK